jgi:ubiquinone biosynthesis protein
MRLESTAVHRAVALPAPGGREILARGRAMAAGPPVTERPTAGLLARLSNLNRMRQVAHALVRHGFRSIVDQLGFADRSLADPTPQERVSARLGRRLALTLGDLGPTFVKLGQLLATREDLLPAAVTTELAALHDRVRPLPEAVVRQQIEQCLGKPVAQVFPWFDGEPLAAASIAQVHRARTSDGREVVVKVQRPGIAATIADDLAILHQLAELLEDRVEDARRFDPRGVARAFGGGLQRELDFRLEAEAYRRMRGAVGATCRLPEVIEASSGEAVLTLEYLPGRKVTAVADPAVRRVLARRILRSFIRQVLHAGYFHADPHPGNLVAVDGGDELALLDLGAVGVIDAATRATLVRLAASAAARDRPGFARALLAMTESSAPVDLPSFEVDVGRFLDLILARDLREVPLAEITGGLFDLVRGHGLRVRGESFTLVRAVTILDGVLRELDPSLDPLRAAAPHILWATAASGDARPAGVLALAIARGRWRASPRLRVGAVASAATAACGVAAMLGWWALT